MKWLILCLPLFAYAGEEIFSIKRINNFSFAAGNWLENYRQTQSTSSGDVNGFEFNPYLSVQMDYDIKNRFYFLPEIGYILRREINAQTTKDHFFIRADIKFQHKEWISYTIGSSLMIKSYSGNGGEEELDNGSSEETFYAPNERRSSLNQTLDFGVAYHLQKYTFKLQSYIYAINDSDQRMYSHSLSVNYPVWENL